MDQSALLHGCSVQMRRNEPLVCCRLSFNDATSASSRSFACEQGGGARGCTERQEGRGAKGKEGEGWSAGRQEGRRAEEEPRENHGLSLQTLCSDSACAPPYPGHFLQLLLHHVRTTQLAVKILPHTGHLSLHLLHGLCQHAATPCNTRETPHTA